MANDHTAVSTPGAKARPFVHDRPVFDLHHRPRPAAVAGGVIADIEERAIFKGGGCPCRCRGAVLDEDWRHAAEIDADLERRARVLLPRAIGVCVGTGDADLTKGGTEDGELAGACLRRISELYPGAREQRPAGDLEAAGAGVSRPVRTQIERITTQGPGNGQTASADDNGSGSAQRSADFQFIDRGRAAGLHQGTIDMALRR